jgi:phage tail-like protein
MNGDPRQAGYLQYLPAIYRDDGFLDQFLKGFEAILSGEPGAEAERVVGLEEKIDTAASLFLPLAAQPTDSDPGARQQATEFLQWLAGWVALALREDWGEQTQRDLIRDIVSIYPLRGTLKGVERYLKIYAGGGVSITDDLSPMRLGTTSQVGRNTIVGGMAPHLFLVRIAFAQADPQQTRRMADAVRAILDVEKPAHTRYQLNFQNVGMQVGVVDKATLGRNTFI